MGLIGEVEGVKEARAKLPRRRDLSRMLARVDRFDGRQIDSLTSQFRVSVEAMAIRLEELNLVSLDT
jgi:Zn-dependent peptidase ImmA (M78 family)